MNGIATVNAAVQNLDGSPTALDNLPQIIHALEVIYDPRTSNQVRKDATAYLEQAKLHPEAPARGFVLANDRNRSPVIRHYGLSLLEHPIRYQWNNYDQEQAATLRGWVVQLAERVTEEEPMFFRNKIAQLWVDIAERSWVSDWQDMDDLLCKLWQGSFAQQELVLHVLETLSDTVFNQEGSVAGSKSGDLGKACVEIFTPSSLLARFLPHRQFVTVTRPDNDGWLQRLLDTLQRCLDHDLFTQPQIRLCAVKILAVLQSVMPWIILQAVARSNCLDLVCKCLVLPEVSVQMAAVEVLHALYHRSPYSGNDISTLVCPLLSSDGLTLLRKTYQMVQVKADDLDEPKYSMLKKLSEVICALSGFLEQRPQIVAESSDVPGLLQFLVTILQNPSLIVSIPVLYMWTKLLSSHAIGRSEVVSPLVGTLLEICSQRLLRYETLPSDSTNLTLAFLNEDFETMPERHAFVGNYRRFCMDVIEQIVRKSPFEAMRHILGQADMLMSNLYDTEEGFSRESFASNSAPILRVDAQSTVVVTALKSYTRWLAGQRAKGKHHEAEHGALENALEQWCSRLLHVTFEDPVIQKRTLQLIVEISMNALPSTSNMCISICEHVFSKKLAPSLMSSAYDEAIKDLQATEPRELQKLAGVFSDQFFAIYPDLESSVNSIFSADNVDQRVKLDYQAFLFIVILRTSSIDNAERNTRLQYLIRPVVDSWRDPTLERSLADFDSFLQWLGLAQFPRIFLECNASSIEDWSGQRLSPQAVETKADISSRSENLPLQSTRSLLAVSTDRSRSDPDPHNVVSLLWRDSISVILPRLLQCISHSHAFNNPTKWSNYPMEMREILNRVLIDRVWQSGISTESRDDFYARIRRSKSSLEGLASTVRGAVRGVRETSYWILHCMSNLGDTFYAHEGLPEVLARALYADAHTLSAHQLSALLKLSAALIDGCPPGLRSHFLPSILTMLFKQLDVKISSEWEATEHRNVENAGEDGLDQEMKAESVLRALTHSAVMLVASLLGHERQTATVKASEQAVRQDSTQPDDQTPESATNIRTLILSSPNILEDLILFCTHALRMHDSRCCGVITRVLRGLIPEFAEHKQTRATTPPTSPLHIDPRTAYQIREFFSTEVLKACITSLHEPYFADLQKDLAALIASILSLYSTSTETPRRILLSLPGMSEGKVDAGLAEVRGASSERQQRGWVLKLLESVRGVGIHEAGRIGVEGAKGGRRDKSALLEGYMVVDAPGGVVRGGSPELGGVAELFG